MQNQPERSCALDMRPNEISEPCAGRNYAYAMLTLTASFTHYLGTAGSCLGLYLTLPLFPSISFSRMTSLLLHLNQ